MYYCTISHEFFTPEEIALFKPFLEHSSLDECIWPVFSGLFEAGTKNSIPHIVRVYDSKNNDVLSLRAATVVIKCKKYGQALFKNPFLAMIADVFCFPFYQWVTVGCCMDMMSSPVFVSDPKSTAVFREVIAHYLARNTFLTVIYDHTGQNHFYRGATVLPALPHALISTSEITSVADYTSAHKNIRRKIARFEKAGGTFETIHRKLDKKDIESLRNCFTETAKKSSLYLPYQDLYLQAAIHIGQKVCDGVYYFVVRMNGEFIGYQAALKCDTFLNGLHGAFDRSRTTTHHAYDILFVKMVEFAIMNKIAMIDYGVVLNDTKSKMVNKTIDMSYFVLSKSKMIQVLLSAFLRLTAIQDRNLLKYRTRKCPGCVYQ